MAAGPPPLRRVGRGGATDRDSDSAASATTSGWIPSTSGGGDGARDGARGASGEASGEASEAGRGRRAPRPRASRAGSDLGPGPGPGPGPGGRELAPGGGRRK